MNTYLIHLYIATDRCLPPAFVFFVRAKYKHKSNIVIVTNLCVLGLVKTPCKKVRLRRENVQRQEGSVDCGLFALANLVEVLRGGDPRRARFCQKDMRMHLFRCISEQRWEPFPKQAQPVTRIDTADRFKSFTVSYRKT